MLQSKLRKILALGLAATMAVGILAGCGNSAGGGSTSAPAATTGEAGDALDTSKEVELVMYVISDRPNGWDVNEENYNKLFKEKLNCTLKINWLSWAEYANKYPLLFSSGEKFDMAYTATWLNFATLARKGAFMALDDLWPKYAPKNYAAQSEAALAQATVDGHLYCVPTLLATYTGYGMIYRTDILEGTDWDGKMETWEDAEEYGKLVKELHPEMEPFNANSNSGEYDFMFMKSKGYHYVDNGQRYVWFDPKEENPKVFSFADDDTIVEYLEMAQRWAAEGFWSKSVLSDTDTQKMSNGKSCLTVHNIDNYNGQVTGQPQYTWAYAYFPGQQDIGHLPFTQDAMVIPNTATNPERALALWDLITSDQEAFDAFYYGVLGTTYELDEKGDFRILDTDLYSANAMWAARTTELNRNQIGSADDYDSIRADWEKAIVPGKGVERFAAFTFDSTPVQTELAACKNVEQQYWYPLEMGLVDLETGLQEFKDNMAAAGLDKVMAEMQKQLDEFIANN